ncbi:MAG: M20/M25/M40 family metallo-hydrolase, partial [Bacteroidota bacterium]
MYKYCLLLISLFSSSFLFGQDRETLLQDLRVDVVYLASDDLQGRETGTEGEKMAARYIASRFMRMGLSPYGKMSNKKKETLEDYFHVFDFKQSNNPHAAEGEGISRRGTNVVAYLDNGAATTVILGAHYDHIGMGNFGSRHTGEKAIHNGADDNASGVASLIYLAEKLKSSKLKNNNYLFLAFSGEELGLYGSKAFTKSSLFNASKINYMVNMDMVGRLKEERVISINGVGTSPYWKEAIEKIEYADIKTSLTASGIGGSDHTSFYLKDLPAVHF